MTGAEHSGKLRKIHGREHTPALGSFNLFLSFVLKGVAVGAVREQAYLRTPTCKIFDD